MKRKIFNIAFIGLLLSFLLSCGDDNVHTLYDGPPMLTFEFYPAVPPFAAVMIPTHFIHTAGSIHNFNFGIPPAGRTFTLRVALRPFRPSDNIAIPFNIRVMPEEVVHPRTGDITRAITTLNPNAIAFPTSATIAAGESSVTFTFTINHDYLTLPYGPGGGDIQAANLAANRIFLQIVPANEDAVANQQMSRISLQFLKQ